MTSGLRVIHCYINALCTNTFYPVGLMGILEKRRFRNFLIFVNEYDPKDPKTHKGKNSQ